MNGSEKSIGHQSHESLRDREGTHTQLNQGLNKVEFEKDIIQIRLM